MSAGDTTLPYIIIDAGRDTTFVYTHEFKNDGTAILIADTFGHTGIIQVNWQMTDDHTIHIQDNNSSYDVLIWNITDTTLELADKDIPDSNYYMHIRTYSKE